jgi:sigma-B regulation protein RsbU (phosphoserine phosphatase)
MSEATMIDRPATERGSEFWSEFIALTYGQGNERTLVEALLAHFVELTGARGAALYFDLDGIFERQIAIGGDLLPVRLDSSAGESDPQAVRVPGGAVRFRMSDGSSEHGLSPSSIATLATATHAFLLSERMKRQRFEVNYRGVELEALYDVGLAIASTLNLEELSEEVLLRAVSLLDARRGALYLTGEGDFVLHRSSGGAACERIAGDSPEVQTLLDGKSPGRQEIMPGAEHLMAVAIETDQGRKGLLIVADKESRQGVGPFGTSDRRTLGLFANQAAIAIQNAHLHREALEKQRLQREAELAAEIQRQLLPTSVPEITGFELVGWNRPARHVGGDYYNFIPLDGDRTAFLVADVTGKGMPAALMVSTLHSALHLLVDRQPLDAALVAVLNDHIWDASASNKFITLFLGVVQEGSATLRYVSAGHNPALVLRENGDITELAAAGMPLGLFERARFSFGSIDLEPGDLLCTYSDGITECESPEQEEFGMSGLIGLLRDHRRQPLQGIVQAIDKAVRAFAAGGEQGDDQTLVLLRRSG